MVPPGGGVKNVRRGMCGSGSSASQVVVSLSRVKSQLSCDMFRVNNKADVEKVGRKNTVYDVQELNNNVSGG